MRRNAIIGALLLIAIGVVLGATVFRPPDPPGGNNHQPASG